MADLTGIPANPQAQASHAQLTAQLSREVARAQGKLEQLEAEHQQWRAIEQQLVAEGRQTQESLTQAKTEVTLAQTRIHELKQACAKLETAGESKDHEIRELTIELAKRNQDKE